MAHIIVKLADEEYIEYSTVVDAPVTTVMNRDELEEHLATRYGYASLDENRRLIARADEKGTSSPHDHSAEETLRANRAGQGEMELTLDEIREEYA